MKKIIIPIILMIIGVILFLIGAFMPIKNNEQDDKKYNYMIGGGVLMVSGFIWIAMATEKKST